MIVAVLVGFIQIDVVSLPLAGPLVAMTRGGTRLEVWLLRVLDGHDCSAWPWIGNGSSTAEMNAACGAGWQPWWL